MDKMFSLDEIMLKFAYTIDEQKTIAPKPYQSILSEGNKYSSALTSLYQPKSSLTTANQSCQPSSNQQSKFLDAEPPSNTLSAQINDSYKSVYNTSSQLITNDSKKFFPIDTKSDFHPLPHHPKATKPTTATSNFHYPASSANNLANPESPVIKPGSDENPIFFTCVNFKPTKAVLTRNLGKDSGRNASSPKSNLYDIICKEKQSQGTMSSVNGVSSKETDTPSNLSAKGVRFDGAHITDAPLPYQPSATLFNTSNLTNPKNDCAGHHSLPADESGGQIKQLGHLMNVLDNMSSKPLSKQSPPRVPKTPPIRTSSLSRVVAYEGNSTRGQPLSPSRMPMPKGNLHLASELNHNSINIYNNNDDSNVVSNTSRISGSTASAKSNGHHASVVSNDPGKDRDGGRSERIAKYKEERRKQLNAVGTAAVVPTSSALASDNSDKCDQQNNSVMEGVRSSEVDRKATCNRPDSLTGVGKRYITRSSRTQVSSSDSSSSPVHALLGSTNHVKSPLKSPSRTLATSNSRNNSPIHQKGARSNVSPLATSTLRTSATSQSPSRTAGITSTSRQNASSPPSSGGVGSGGGSSPLHGRQQSATSNNLGASSQAIRTTKTSRLRAAALVDKKSKDSSEEPVARSSVKAVQSSFNTGPKLAPELLPAVDSTLSTAAPLSPLHRIRIGVSATRKANTISGLPSGFVLPSVGESTASASMAPSSATKKLFPSISVSLKQTLNELSVDGSRSLSKSPAPAGGEGMAFPIRSPDIDYTLKLRHGSVASGNASSPGLSPTRSSRTSASPSASDRDKSAKRKSNLNRALNEESTKEDDAALRRRRRRELGMARQLIPTDDTSFAIRDAISPLKNATSPIGAIPSPRNDLAFHMANARKEVLSGSSDRQRANTGSPKAAPSPSGAIKVEVKVTRRSPEKNELVPLTRSFNKESDYLRKNKKLTDTNVKTESPPEEAKSRNLDEATKYLTQSNELNAKDESNTIAASSGWQSEPMASTSGANIIHLDSDPNFTSKKFTKKDRISFDGSVSDDISVLRSQQSSPRKMLKTQSHDSEVAPDFQGLLGAPRMSPSSRRKSSEDQVATSHIVSILKKKDNQESSSASSNASPVTFSSSVMDTPTRSSKRQGILKKRSSLDESRYSRSHSPDEKSILVRTPRRNSLEETHHGILKQRSYESKSDGCPSVEPQHGILKKKDSISTPSENQAKHVSISQAVILAAAELCKDIITDSDYDIKPILKSDIIESMPNIPKPILKKKHSSETEEIRPILKTSRKSSREESSDIDELVRPILKIDSPAKRRSLVDSVETNIVFQRSRSLEHPEDPWDSGATTSGVVPLEKPIISVAERVRNMERFIIDGSNGAISKHGRSSSLKRDMYKSRFRTQPVTVDEIKCLHSTSVDLFKPGSLEYLSCSLKTSPRSTSSYSPTSSSSRPITDQYSPNSVSAELNCLSLSSDSGLHTGKVSEMSASGDNVSTSSVASVTPTTKSVASESSSSTTCGIVKDETVEDDSFTKCGSLENKEFAKDDSGGDMDKDRDELMSPPSGGATGLVRSSSVRARATMFQQLEERMKQGVGSDEKPLPPKVRKVPSGISTSSASAEVTPTHTAATIIGTEGSDSEFEPSTLPLSERLKIFSGERSLSQTEKSKSPPIRRSQTTSSVEKELNPLKYEKLTTKPARQHSDPIVATPKSSAPKRLRLRTVGKLAVPTFFDANNNETSCEAKENNEEYYPRKIGKIKSPFLENNNGGVNSISMKMKTPTPTKIITELNFDSGKENYDSNHSNVSRKFQRSNSKDENGTFSASKVDEKLAKYFGMTKNSKEDNNTLQNGHKEAQRPGEIYRSSSAVILEVVKPRQPRQLSLQTSINTPDSPMNGENNVETPAEKRRSFGSRRSRAMTTIVNNTPDKTPKRMSLRQRALTVANGRPLSLLNPKNMITRYEDLHVTKEDLLTAAKEFEQIFLELTKSSTTSSMPPQSKLLSAVGGGGFEPRKSILKSKSGCVGMFPTDLSSELKSRLKKSTHATVSNLKKSATSDQPIPRLSADASSMKSAKKGEKSPSDSESDEGVDPQKNLAKILRSVSKENMNKTSRTHPQPPVNQKTACASSASPAVEIHPPDVISLVRSLASLEKRSPSQSEPQDDSENVQPGAASTSEGESSGGREISSIIKNGAIARRRKLNEG